MNKAAEEKQEKQEKQDHAMHLLGGTTGYILRFSLPIIAGNILQQLYNTMDAVIVGRFLGEHSLAAVSVASPLMSLLIFFTYGIGIGMTVLFSQKYGSGKMDAYRTAASTALTCGSAFILFLSFVCFTAAEPLLLFSRAPQEILGEASLYLRVVIVGLIFTFLYDYYNAAFLSIGDSRTPFYALAGSSFLNIILDVIFVAVLRMGVAGAAAATVIAQGTSMAVCTLYVRRRCPILHFRFRELRAEKTALGELIRYSGAAAFQQSILYGGRLLVQGAVNTLSIGVIAGYGAACRIESFILAPLEGVASSASSYCAKATGRKDRQSVKEGFFSGMKVSAFFNVIISCSIFFLSPRIIPLFLPESGAETLWGGIIYLRYMAFFYISVSVTQMLQALMRGIGRLRVTILNSMLQISLRVACSYLLIGRLGIRAVCWGTFIGWLGMIVYGGWHAARYFREEGPQ